MKHAAATAPALARVATLAHAQRCSATPPGTADADVLHANASHVWCNTAHRNTAGCTKASMRPQTTLVHLFTAHDNAWKACVCVCTRFVVVSIYLSLEKSCAPKLHHLCEMVCANMRTNELRVRRWSINSCTHTHVSCIVNKEWKYRRIESPGGFGGARRMASRHAAMRLL